MIPKIFDHDPSIDFKDTKTLVFMHGAGSNASFIEGLINDGTFPKKKHEKIIVLQSPLTDVGKTGNAKTPWIRKTGEDRHYDEDDIENMSTGVANIILDQIDKYRDVTSDPESRVFLAGKSQGALISLYT